MNPQWHGGFHIPYVNEIEEFKRLKINIGIVPINMESDFLERSMKLKKLIMRMATPSGRMP